MKVSVIAFGMLRDYLPGRPSGRPVEVEVDTGATVADVARSLGMPDKAVFAILVDGRRAQAGSVLSDGAELTLMPAFTGGSTHKE